MNFFNPIIPILYGLFAVSIHTLGIRDHTTHAANWAKIARTTFDLIQFTHIGKQIQSTCHHSWILAEPLSDFLQAQTFCRALKLHKDLV